VAGSGIVTFSHDPSAGNDVKYVYDNGMPFSSPGWFVQVLAGPDMGHLQPLTGTLGGPLSLNRGGVGAGYTTPFSDIYTVPGMTAGQSVWVAYQPFQGSSLPPASYFLGFRFGLSPVILTEPPTPPHEVALGIENVTIPEPATAALGLLACFVAVSAWAGAARDSRPEMKASHRITNGCTEPGDSAFVPGRASVAPGR